MIDDKDIDRVYDVYNCAEGKCAVVSRGWDYYVITSDGDEFEMDEYSQARIYAGLRALFGDIELRSDGDYVPTEIAIAGKPAVVTYLFACNPQHYRDFGAREHIEELDIMATTIQKYLRRVANQAKEKRIDGLRDDVMWR